MPRNHYNPFGDASVYGNALQPGDKIEKGDVWASVSGKWRVAVPLAVGLVIEAGCETYWVRPVKKPEGGSDEQGKKQ